MEGWMLASALFGFIVGVTLVVCACTDADKRAARTGTITLDGVPYELTRMFPGMGGDA